MQIKADIWRQLQDHPILPPQEVTDLVLSSIPTPENNTMNSFEKLQDHGAQPPAALLNAIKKKLSDDAGAAPTIKPSRSTSPFLLLTTAALSTIKRHPLVAAASTLTLVAGIGYLVASQRTLKAPHSIATSQPVAINHSVTPAPATPIDSTQTNNNTPDSASQNVAGNIASPDNSDTRGQKDAKEAAFQLNGEKLNLVDNDLLLTFTSFKYPATANLINKNNNLDLKVQVDQYANIIISRPVADMLKSMYTTRTNGKLTRKARKAKARLEDWKKSDEQHFDNHSPFNPIDAADLACFIANPDKKAANPKPAAPSTPAVDQLAARPATGPDNAKDLTVSYQISIHGKHDNAGIGETYNGGIKTLFISGQHARLRLVSLMRIQSEFAQLDNGSLNNITLLKESGPSHKKTRFTNAEWKAYNDKYKDLTCHLTKDTATFAGYPCLSALLTLKDGRQLTAWYTPKIQKPASALLDPAFSAIPGLVLKYEITYKKYTLSYTATSVSRIPIHSSVFDTDRLKIDTRGR